MSSIKKIADRANVSRATVDRVIHHRGGVAKDKEAKIKKIIEELNFKPNIYASNLKRGKTYTIAVIIPAIEHSDSFWTLPIQGIDKALTELQKLKIIVKYFYYSSGKKEISIIKAIKESLESKPSGLIIVPINSEKFKQYLLQLPKKIPYVFIDSTISNVSPLTSIYQDLYQSGFTAGRFIDLIKINRKDVGVMKFFHEDLNIKERVKGFISYFKSNPKIRINIYKFNSDWDFKHLKLQIKKYLSEIDYQLGGIFVPNAMGFIVADILEEKKKKIPLISYDLIKTNHTHLLNDRIDFIIGQRPETQGYIALNILFRHIVLHENVEKVINMPIDIITKENVIYYNQHIVG